MAIILRSNKKTQILKTNRLHVYYFKISVRTLWTFKLDTQRGVLTDLGKSSEAL